MKLTSKGRYAVTAMLDLALHAGDEPVALADIAKRNRISAAYLEQLLSGLRREGLVESTRGPGGGYRLALAPSAINVARVIAAVNEDVDATRCGGERNCHDGGRCLTHDLWEDLSAHVRDFLESVTLADWPRAPGAGVSPRSFSRCAASRRVCRPPPQNRHAHLFRP